MLRTFLALKLKKTKNIVDGFLEFWCSYKRKRVLCYAVTILTFATFQCRAHCINRKWQKQDHPFLKNENNKTKNAGKTSEKSSVEECIFAKMALHIECRLKKNSLLQCSKLFSFFAGWELYILQNGTIYSWVITDF